MLTNSGVEESSIKHEDRARHDKPATTRPWPTMRNPRIVRMSRAFGGKDRHSKVTTVRGLRDRRVRLSVPTAIQLYNLQDKLGLNQPSKVVDWLLNAAQHEIDKLPPLQMPPGNFIQFPQMVAPKTSSLHAIGDHANEVENATSRTGQLDLTTMYWNSDIAMRMRSNEASKESNRIHQRNEQSVGLDRSTTDISFSSYSHNWEPSSGYIADSGSHPSQAEVFQQTAVFATNLGSKQYNYFDSRGLMNASQESIAFRHQDNHEEH